MHVRNLVQLGVLFFCGTVVAQVTPDHYARIVHERCPGADIVKVQRAAFDLLEVDYFCQGKKVELGIHNGQVVYEEHEGTPEEAVMQRIQKSLDKKYPGWLLDEVSLITAMDSTFIKVEVVMEGVEHNLYFTTTGRKYDPRGLMVSDGWSATELAAAMPADAPYDLLHADSSYALPALLREVSGIAVAGPSSVYCVQDELGAVFEFCLATEEILRVLRFTDVGDFEDVAVQGNRITALRSDGKLFTLDRESGAVVSERQYALPALNYEGLCLAPDGSLLLVSKEAPVVGEVHTRPVHRIRDGRVDLFRQLDASAVAAHVAQHWPTVAKGPVRFSPSAVAVHPVTGELYVLSSADRLVAVYGETLQRVLPLPAADFYKPEGLAFLPNGDLLISNEGDKKGLVQANVLRFRWKGR